jgi:hypothetical protein
MDKAFKGFVAHDVYGRALKQQPSIAAVCAVAALVTEVPYVYGD